MKESIAKRLAAAQPTMLDRAISWLSPATGLERQRARQTMALTGGYDAGSRSSRSMRNMRTAAMDADAASLYDLPTLRERSRDLVRNAPLATGAVNTVVTNVVGSGLVFQSRLDRAVLDMDDDEASEWESNTEREFALFAANCDIERTSTLSDLQELAFRSTLENGDCFVLLTQARYPGSPYSLKLQLIEADRVSNPKLTPDSAHLSGGVEKGPGGAPAFYHVAERHPGDMRPPFKFQWRAIPAFTPSGRRNVLHLFSKSRIGQTRGIPYLAPVIEPLKQLDDYTEAEVTAAVIAGLYTVFVQSPDGMGDLSADGIISSDPESKKEVSLGKGTIVNLDPGQVITAPNPGRPNSAFDPFVQAILRQIGVALEIPFEILIKHFTASYSAARAALLEAWKFFYRRRAWLVARLCEPVYEAWMDEAVATGRIIAPGYFEDPIIRQAWLGCRWIGPARGMIDETKEVDAARMKVELGISTRADAAAELNGSDFESNVSQLKKEKDMLTQAGLMPTVTPWGTAPTSPAPGGDSPKNNPDQQDQADQPDQQDIPEEN